MNRTILVLSCCLYFPLTTFGAEDRQSWEPPKQSERAPGYFIGAGALVEGYFVSSAAFEDIWKYYAHKLEIKLPYKSGSYGFNPAKGADIFIINQSRPHSDVLASSLIRRESDRDISVFLVGAGDSGVRIFLSILPRR